MFHPGDDSYGIDRVLVRVAATLTDAGYDVECALDSRNPGSGWLSSELTRVEVPFRTIPLNIVSRSELATSLRLARWLVLGLLRLPSLIRLARSADVVYVNGFVLVVAAAAARLSGRKVVWHLHEIPPGGRWAGRIVRLLSTHQVCVSRAVAASFGLTGSAHTTVIHNAVDLPQTAVLQPEVDPENPLEIGIVARINAGKGHLVFAAAITELLAQDLPIRAHVVGGPHVSDVTVAAELSRRLNSVPDDRVVWAGEVGSGAAYMQKLHVLAAPSVRPDPFPLSVLEGMAAGLVVVASNTGGHPEAVIDGVTGLLVTPGDAVQLAERLRGLVHDRQQRLKLASAAREEVACVFAPARFAEAIRATVGLL